MPVMSWWPVHGVKSVQEGGWRCISFNLFLLAAVYLST
jgi:hypothetical protein